jgi:hypothetical protein
MATQDLEIHDPRELYRLDPDYVTIPAGPMPMTSAVFWSLVALRLYLVALIVLVGYRFVAYAHLIRH